MSNNCVIIFSHHFVIAYIICLQQFLPWFRDAVSTPVRVVTPPCDGPVTSLGALPWTWLFATSMTQTILGQKEDLSSISRCGDTRSETNVEEINKIYAAHQDKIKELEVLIEKLIKFSLPTVTVVISFVAVLAYTSVKMWFTSDK